MEARALEPFAVLIQRLFAAIDRAALAETDAAAAYVSHDRGSLYL